MLLKLFTSLEKALMSKLKEPNFSFFLFFCFIDEILDKISLLNLLDIKRRRGKKNNTCNINTSRVLNMAGTPRHFLYMFVCVICIKENERTIS